MKVSLHYLLAWSVTTEKAENFPTWASFIVILFLHLEAWKILQFFFLKILVTLLLLGLTRKIVCLSMSMQIFISILKNVLQLYPWVCVLTFHPTFAFRNGCYIAVQLSTFVIFSYIVVSCYGPCIFSWNLSIVLLKWFSIGIPIIFCHGYQPE